MPKKKTKSLVITKLNPNQKMFCELYAGGGEYFGNAAWSYVLAYKLDIPVISYKLLTNEQRKVYDSACAMAVTLLRNVKVKNFCNDLVDALIKDEIVDRELVKVILQMDELSPKVAAIREYNQLKKRVSDTPPAPAQDLHLHLHESPRILQIIKNAEEELLKELDSDINA
uniref:Putative terminase n=1 Tax=viral metagenome TaxID=1070528 RepID=A0A6M3ILW4_9ZZZZ